MEALAFKIVEFSEASQREGETVIMAKNNEKRDF